MKQFLSYFTTLADALGKSPISGKERIGKLLKTYGGILAAVPYLGEKLGKIAAALGLSLSAVGLDERRKRIDALLARAGFRVAVLMDDIDRLDKSEIQALFRIVKLTADFKYTAYVLAFDNEMVAAALKEQYPGKGLEGGKSFLEKIVQVPLHLPQAEPEALRGICFQGVQAALDAAGISISKEEAASYAHRFTQTLETWVRTPRMAKRYGNALAFSLPLVRGEVNTVDFLLIEGLRVLMPGLFATIRDNPDAFVRGWTGNPFGEDKAKERSDKIVEKALEDLPDQHREAARQLLEGLFPRIGKMGYGLDWEDPWAKEKRVASQEYFKRYFVYGVPPTDIAEREIEDVLLAAERGDVQEVAGCLGVLIRSRDASTLIAKMRKRETACSPKASETLAMAVGQAAAQLPRPPSLFPGTSTSSQASILVNQLLRNVPAAERLEVAKRVLLKAEPLPFAAECLLWMRPNDKREDTKPQFSQEDIADIGKVLAGRVKETAAGKVMYKEYPDEALSLMSLWAAFGSQDEVRSYLRETITQDAQNAPELLRSFTGNAWSGASPIAHKADFQRNNYDTLAQFMDTDQLYATLQVIYGERLDSSDYPRFDNGPPDERIARQFAWIHRKVAEEKSGAATGAAPANP